MKRGSLLASADSEGFETPTSKVLKTSKMYQKAGLASAGVRVITRSKARAEAALESRHRCPEGVAESRASVHAAISPDPASAMPDVQLSAAPTSMLPVLAAATTKQRSDHTKSVTVHGCTKLPAPLHSRMTSSTAYHGSKPLAESLLRQPSDDLEQLDITPAISSKIIHPSLLQHPGMTAAKRQQHVPTAAQAAAPAAAGQAHQHAPPPARARCAAAEQPTTVSYSTDDSSSDSDTSAQHQRPARRVSFAPGPLSPQVHNNCTPDGHPATEGAQVFPVRRLAPGYALDLTKGNV